MSTQCGESSLGALATCECCGETKGVQFESSRTAYSPKPMTRWERLRLPDPLLPPSPLERFEAANPDLLLCRDCAAEHHAQWNQQWAEYYSGLL